MKQPQSARCKSKINPLCHNPPKLITVMCLLILTQVDTVLSATPDMQHTGRVQALVSERTIPFNNLNYNHEGTIEVMKNGNVIALWQSSKREGDRWGWAMSSIWDGETWSFPRPMNIAGPDRCYTPVPFQAEDGTLLAFVHNGEFPNWPTDVYHSNDNGITWNGPHPIPADNGETDFCTFSRPMQFPDGRIMGAMIIDDQGDVKLRTMPANNITGPWSNNAGWNTTDLPNGEYIYLGGSIVPLSDDYQNLAHFIWKNVFGYNIYSVSNDGGNSWSGWIKSMEANHNHAIELDPDGGPLHGYIAMATAGSNRNNISIGFARKEDLISGNSSPFTSYLKLDNRTNPAMEERTAQGIVQTPDRLVHITSNGRGAKSVQHYVVDPDILLNNTTVNKPGYITCLGAARKVTESGSAVVSVQRVGGAQGAAS
ncbi:MAG: hypothetical protein GF398_12315, partial [Chitinivibrionales bacterium]|nr:hypothetical protein [Chitinivibrionales bacterium]